MTRMVVVDEKLSANGILLGVADADLGSESVVAPRYGDPPGGKGVPVLEVAGVVVGLEKAIASLSSCSLP